MNERLAVNGLEECIRDEFRPSLGKVDRAASSTMSKKHAAKEGITHG